MIKLINYLNKAVLLVVFLSFNYSPSQEIIPETTLRVDTTQTEIKRVYEVYKEYLNAEMDSIYANPYWNLKDWKLEDRNCNRAINFLMKGVEADYFLSVYPPKILQIDSVNIGRYQIKTLFALECPSEKYKLQTPMAITKLYAVRQLNGEFKLENLIDYDTRLWKHHQNGFINYIVSPTVELDLSRACEAGKFYKNIAKQFDIKEIPKIDFYLTSNTDELMRLFNFEYVLSYTTGLALTNSKEVYTSFGDPLFKHELVHMLIPGKTYIITEGVATWLGGPRATETFGEALKNLSMQFQKKRPQSLQEIMDFTYRNKFDNNVIYITGAVICQMAYDREGVSGIKILLKCDDDTFKEAMETVFCMPFCELEQKVINYIVDYNK